MYKNCVGLKELSNTKVWEALNNEQLSKYILVMKYYIIINTYNKQMLKQISKLNTR